MSDAERLPQEPMIAVKAELGTEAIATVAIANIRNVLCGRESEIQLRLKAIDREDKKMVKELTVAREAHAASELDECLALFGNALKAAKNNALPCISNISARNMPGFDSSSDEDKIIPQQLVVTIWTDEKHSPAGRAVMPAIVSDCEISKDNRTKAVQLKKEKEDLQAEVLEIRRELSDSNMMRLKEAATAVAVKMAIVPGNTAVDIVNAMASIELAGMPHAQKLLSSN